MTKQKLRFSQLRTVVVLHTIVKRYTAQAVLRPDSDSSYLAYQANRDFIRLCKLYKIDPEATAKRLSHAQA